MSNHSEFCCNLQEETMEVARIRSFPAEHTPDIPLPNLQEISLPARSPSYAEWSKAPALKTCNPRWSIEMHHMIFRCTENTFQHDLEWVLCRRVVPFSFCEVIWWHIICIIVLNRARNRNWRNLCEHDDLRGVIMGHTHTRALGVIIWLLIVCVLCIQHLTVIVWVSLINTSSSYTINYIASSFIFLPRDTMHKRDTNCRSVFVCPSVRPSVRPSIRLSHSRID